MFMNVNMKVLEKRNLVLKSFVTLYMVCENQSNGGFVLVFMGLEFE